MCPGSEIWHNISSASCQRDDSLLSSPASDLKLTELEFATLEPKLAAGFVSWGILQDQAWSDYLGHTAIACCKSEDSDLLHSYITRLIVTGASKQHQDATIISTTNLLANKIAKITSSPCNDICFSQWFFLAWQGWTTHFLSRHDFGSDASWLSVFWLERASGPHRYFMCRDNTQCTEQFDADQR